jgi:hypothetical protein
MQQLYAKIKKSSKYDGQGDGKPFPVTIDGRGYDDYLIQGGPGGCYRLGDVNLYVLDVKKDGFLKIA